MSKTMKFTFVFAFAVLVSHYQCHGSAILPVANSGDRSYGVEENVVDGVGAEESSLQGCLRKDSISCLQMHVFRMAKRFLDQPAYNILNGISVVKVSKQSDGRSLVDSEKVAAENVEKARSVEEREDALEKYLSEEMSNFFEKRDINWNLESVGRSIQENAPESIKNIIGAFMEEGRGRKKVLRMLLPFLFGLKVKLATVLGIAYLGAILLAKKALVMSLISIAISVFLLVKKMFSHGEVAYPMSHGYNGGWQSHIDVGHVEYAPQTPAQAGQNLAYSAQKPASRR